MRDKLRHSSAKTVLLYGDASGASFPRRTGSSYRFMDSHLRGNDSTSCIFLLKTNLHATKLAKTPESIISLIQYTCYLLVWILGSSPTMTNASSKTNINKISDEFGGIKNKAQLDGEINSLRENATVNPDSGAMREIFAPNESQISDLARIDEFELGNLGLTERSKHIYFNEFETDYTRPGAAAHKKDAEDIVKATEEKMQVLTERLKEAGIDCENSDIKTKEIEDQYYIEIEKEHHKEVEYDQIYCEYPYNTYSCQDSMTTRCLKPNKKWTDWEFKTIRVTGEELMEKAQGAFHFNHEMDEVFEMKLYSSNSRGVGPRGRIPYNSVPSMKAYLITRHKPSSPHHIIEISEDMKFGWEGGVYGVSGKNYLGRVLGGKDYIWRTYVITYHHREGEPICEKWGEPEWSESCLLK